MTSNWSTRTNPAGALLQRLFGGAAVDAGQHPPCPQMAQRSAGPALTARYLFAKHSALADPLVRAGTPGRVAGRPQNAACSGFTRITAHRIAQPPRRPLSRGSSPVGYPTKPLAGFRTYRQLSAWNAPHSRRQSALPATDSCSAAKSCLIRSAHRWGEQRGRWHRL
jgi:hypothetical protein